MRLWNLCKTIDIYIEAQSREESLHKYFITCENPELMSVKHSYKPRYVILTYIPKDQKQSAMLVK